MRAQSICLASAIVLLCPYASAQWVQTDGPYSGNIQCLAISGTALFAGAYGGVFLTTDNGTTWTAASTDLTNTDVFGFTVSGTNLFAGSYGGGVFLSTNNLSWTAVSKDMTDTLIHALAVSVTNVFAGTFGGRVWRRPLSEMIADVERGEVPPAIYVLEQNYPNPFNPSTTINYELPRTSEVRLSVYDMLGREVSVLVNDKREAGVHEVKFDGSGLAAGVYFYRVQAGDFAQTKRLVLLK